MTEAERLAFIAAAETYFKFRGKLEALQMLQTLDAEDVWLNQSRVAEMVGKDLRTLRRWVSCGKFPAPERKKGNQRLWRKTTVDRWLDQPQDVD